MRFEKLPWDSSLFGFPTGRLTGGISGNGQYEEFRQWRDKECLVCVYGLVDPGDVGTLHLLEADGFRICDLRVTLEWNKDTAPGPEETGSSEVRLCRPEDVAVLKEVARNCHGNTRFYKDVRFPTAKADELYSIWVEKAWRDPNSTVYVADQGGGAAGYITCDHVNPSGGRVGLVAVSKSARGLGLGGQLVNQALLHFSLRSVTVVDVVTQADNHEAMRLYQRHGFRVRDIGIWLHWWRQA